MERLEAAKKKFSATKSRLTTAQFAQDKLESANKNAEGEFKESENMMTEVEKEIANKKCPNYMFHLNFRNEEKEQQL